MFLLLLFLLGLADAAAPACNSVDGLICLNGGRCFAGASSTPQCDCRPGFSGATCQNIDPCSAGALTCSNGGVCQSLAGGIVTCSCQSGFHGLRCEHATCSPVNTCRNGGVCTTVSSDSIQRASCVCAPAFGGANCEQTIDACGAGDACLNGGICGTDHSTGLVVCNCGGTGHTGLRCETEIPLGCSSNPCRNEGVCTNGAVRGTFSCSCDTFWTGPECTNPNPCTYPTSPCGPACSCVIHKDCVFRVGFPTTCEIDYTRYDCIC